MDSVLNAALSYLSNGVTSIPIAVDGTKAPATSEWSSLTKKAPTEKKLRAIFVEPCGIAILGGKTSGGLEIIDFDRGEFFQPWAELVEHVAPGLLAALPVVKTPNGYHVYFRSEHCGNNQKLAMGKDPTPGKNSTCIIETRGQGGYVIAPPSPPGVHPSGIAYKMHQGDLNFIPNISKEDRDFLLDAARSFDEVPKEEEQAPRVSVPGQKGRPGDDFNEKATWDEILLPHGWKIVRQLGRVTHWQRPGKSDRTLSATTGYTGDKLYVFSSNAVPFEAGRVYSKFTAYGRLAHGGDFKAAGKALKARGFGDQREPMHRPSDDQWAALNAGLEGISSPREFDEPPPPLPTDEDFPAEEQPPITADELQPLLDDDNAAALVEPTFSRLLAMRDNRAEWERIQVALRRARALTSFTKAVKEHDKKAKRKRAHEGWEQRLKYRITKSGDEVLENILTNHVSILQHHHEWKDCLAFDQFANQIYCRKEPPFQMENGLRWTDRDILKVKMWFEEHYAIRPSTTAVMEAVEVAAKEDSFNALVEYLDKLPKLDGNSVLDTWLSDLFGAPDTAYTRAVGAKWMIAAVARAYEPGCKADYALILEGDQGLKKSRVLNQLCPVKEWFTDGLSDFGSKAQAEEVEGKWIIELGELKGFGKELDLIKAFIVRQAENYRPAYARFTIRSPRKCVFAGTVNPQNVGYLRDETGNRRFWPVRCSRRSKEISPELRDALWAEARDRYKAGEQWWLDEETEKLAKEEQAQRLFLDPWHELIEDIVRAQHTISADEIMGQLNIEKAKRDNAAAQRIGRVMSVLKWERKQLRMPDGRRVWRYENPSFPVQHPLPNGHAQSAFS